MPPRTGKERLLREEILDAAESQFLAHGFSSITVDDLAFQLGISKKTLYQHFSSKKELLNSVLKRRLSTIQQGLDRAISSRGGFIVRLVLLLEYLSQRLAEIKQPFLRDIMRHAPESFRLIETFRERLIPQYFRELFRLGKRSGDVRKELNEELIVTLVLNSIQSIIVPEVVLKLNMPLRDVYSMIIDITLRGVLTQRGLVSYLEKKTEIEAGEVE